MADVTKSEAPRPEKAIEFLGKKVKVETEKWDDLKWGEHSHALTVAHSTNAGVLDEIHRLLNDAIEKGTSFQDFRNGMLDMMKKSGWYGGAGHTEKEKKYINWRIGVIYDTNMKTAYAQAEYRDQLQGASLRPIWVYQSQLTGSNRRQEHIALHGKAFRYDDRFWDTHYPPNGWGCECYVDTESEYGAEKAGVKVEDSKNITPPEIDPTWAYNVGREALAPNFSKYKNLPKETLHQIMRNYNQRMAHATITKEGLKVIAKRANEIDYLPTGIMYQIGNLNETDYAAVREKVNIFDSKVMATDHDLWHSMGHKHKRVEDAKAAGKSKEAIQRLKNQAVDFKDFETVYKTYSAPEQIFLQRIKMENETKLRLHFIKNMGNGRTLRIVFDTRDTRKGKITTALQLVTMEMVESHEYVGNRYEIVK